MRSGVMAEFDSPTAFASAHDRLRAQGYTHLESWTPYPVRPVVRQAPESPVAWMMLAGGLLGAALGYLIQWWCNANDYPIDVGGRPLDSAPSFIPITFESGVLASSLTGFFGMLALCGLPRLLHPAFEIDGFERSAVDRFWLGVDDSDPCFDQGLTDDLSRMGALRCERVRPPGSRGAS